jgi:hypothetical protein
MSGGKTTIPVKTRNDKQSQCLERAFLKLLDWKSQKKNYFVFCIEEIKNSGTSM